MQWITQSLKMQNGHVAIVGHCYAQSRMSEEIQATGIDAEVGYLMRSLNILLEKKIMLLTVIKKKAEADKKAAEETRIKAMERFGNTRKRGGKDGEKGAKKKKKEN